MDCKATSCLLLYCCLQDAGSAEVFKKVDHDYVAAAAAAAKAAGVPYFGLVSAQGANAGMPASDWKLLHPLLYTRTKGLVSSNIKVFGFLVMNCGSCALAIYISSCFVMA
jgi:hypothetical protein